MRHVFIPPSVPALLASMAVLAAAAGTPATAQRTYGRVLERATTFALEPGGVWSLSNNVASGLPDLVLLKTSNTPSGRVEVHIASAASNYQARTIETATTFANEPGGVWALARHAGGGLPDLVFVKTSDTPGGRVEVHIASGASRWQARTLEVPTTFASEQNGTWGIVADPAGSFPDLYFIKTANTPGGTVEVHIASGASRYQSRTLDVATDFRNEADGAWSLLPNLPRTSVPGLAYIKTSNTPNGHVEVHIAQFGTR
jgi:hypothetical protein